MRDDVVLKPALERASLMEARELRAPRAIGAKARAALPLKTVAEGMHVRRLVVRAADVVFVKGLLEASDGLAGLFSERGGDLVVLAPCGREAELREFLLDLTSELGACVEPLEEAGTLDEGMQPTGGSALVSVPGRCRVGAEQRPS